MRIGLLLASLLLLTGCAQANQETSANDLETPQPTQTQVEEVQPETNEPEPEASVEPEDQQDQPSAEPEEKESSEPEESESAPEQSPDSTEPESTETETTEPSPTPTQEPASGITLADVAARDSAAECWVAIDGNVYDLTAWARSHPGGRGAILNLCGTDGTAEFLSKHGGEARPSSTLDDYYLGPLS